MSRLRELMLRVRALVRKDRLEDAMDEELRFHLERQIEDNIKAGMNREEARCAAQRAFGGVEQIKEECRDVRGMRPVEEIWQDLTFGMRIMRKNPGFTCAVLLTLAFGIGANIAIFSLTNGILLRPLPFKDPGRLVFISEWSQQVPVIHVAFPNFVDWRDQNQLFEQMAIFRPQTYNSTGFEEPERLLGAEVTADFFSLLGVKPNLGRTFRTEEDRPGNDPVVILSYGLWQRRFGSDPNILGRTLTLNGDTYSVIGVMPPEFPAPSRRTELWTPLGRFGDEPWMKMRDVHPGTFVYARLKPGVMIVQAQAQMDALATRLERQHPETNHGHRIRVVDLTRWVVGDTRTALWLLSGAVAFVLLITCANVANLLLARSVVRRKETAIRTALGARRGRIVRQLLTESALLAFSAAALGLLLGSWGMEAFKATLPANTPRLTEVQIDGWVLTFTLGLAVLTTLLFGLAPAWQASRCHLNETLKEGGRGATGGPRRVRGALVVLEVALSLVLLISAGLMIKSFIRLHNVDIGFNPESVLSFQLSLPAPAYAEPGKQVAFFKQLIERLQALPGIEAAATIAPLPLLGANWQNNFVVENSPAPPPGQAPLTDIARISPDYFRVMRIQLLRGRYFTDQDHAKAPPVAIVDETLARTSWPDQEPVGKRIKINLGDWNGPWFTIVGVVAHVKNYGADQASRVQTYLPYAQYPVSWTNLVLRTRVEPASVAALVRPQLRQLDKTLPLYNVRTMEEIVKNLLAQRRLSMILLGIFAIIAVMLAAVGIYGVLSYSITQHTHEIGVRLALGAQAADVFRMVVGQGLILALIGVGIGVSAAFALTRLLADLLYGVSPTDLNTFSSVSLLLTGVALLASYIPARRAIKVNPMVALRQE